MNTGRISPSSSYISKGKSI